MATKNDLCIPTQLRLSEFNVLKAIEQKVSSGEVYRLVLPEGKAGGLMTLSSGDMKGYKTTSIVCDGKIIGSAGLKKIELDESVASLLFSINRYNLFAHQFNHIACRLDNLIHTINRERQASVNNIFSIFRDISRKMPEYLANDNYAKFAIAQLTELKILTGEYFELKKIDFRDNHGSINYQQKNIDYLINELSGLRNHEVFKAFEMLVMIEIYEIIISREYSSGLLRRSREGLTERISGLLNILSEKKAYIDSCIKSAEEINKGYQMTYFEHMKALDQTKACRQRLEDSYYEVSGLNKIISSSLNEEFLIEGKDHFYIEFVEG